MNGWMLRLKEDCRKHRTPDHCGINMLFPEACNSQVHLGVYPVAAPNNSMHQGRIIEQDTAVF